MRQLLYCATVIARLVAIAANAHRLALEARAKAGSPQDVAIRELNKNRSVAMLQEVS
jgi:hypothetical protein